MFSSVRIGGKKKRRPGNFLFKNINKNCIHYFYSCPMSANLITYFYWKEKGDNVCWGILVPCATLFHTQRTRTTEVWTCKNKLTGPGIQAIQTWPWQAYPESPAWAHWISKATDSLDSIPTRHWHRDDFVHARYLGEPSMPAAPSKLTISHAFSWDVSGCDPNRTYISIYTSCINRGYCFNNIDIDR